jgi:hypothetical protein
VIPYALDSDLFRAESVGAKVGAQAFGKRAVPDHNRAFRQRVCLAHFERRACDLRQMLAQLFGGVPLGFGCAARHDDGRKRFPATAQQQAHLSLPVIIRRYRAIIPSANARLQESLPAQRI